MGSNQTPPFISCVLLDKSHHRSVAHQFLTCKVAEITTFRTRFVEHFVGCRVQSGHLVNEAQLSTCEPPFNPTAAPGGNSTFLLVSVWTE